MCSWGERHQRIFPSAIQYRVYFDAKCETVPLEWTQNELSVCVACGQTNSFVPELELRELKKGAGE